MTRTADIRRCYEKGMKVVEALREMAGEMDKHARNANISKVAGSVVSIIGAGVAVAGGIASLLTLGLATPVAIAGAAIGGAGAATATGASFVEYILKRLSMGEAEKKYEELLNDPIFLEMNEMPHENLKVKGKTTPRDVAKRTVTAVGHCTSGGKQVAKLVSKQAVKKGAQVVATNAAKAIRVFQGIAVAVEVIALPLTISDLVIASLALHREEKSPAGEKLREIADKIEAQMKQLPR